MGGAKKVELDALRARDSEAGVKAFRAKGLAHDRKQKILAKRKSELEAIEARVKSIMDEKAEKEKEVAEAQAEADAMWKEVQDMAKLLGTAGAKDASANDTTRQPATVTKEQFDAIAKIAASAAQTAATGNATIVSAAEFSFLSA